MAVMEPRWVPQAAVWVGPDLRLAVLTREGGQSTLCPAAWTWARILAPSHMWLVYQECGPLSFQAT